jgi:hypothetical protein
MTDKSEKPADTVVPAKPAVPYREDHHHSPDATAKCDVCRDLALRSQRPPYKPN